MNKISHLNFKLILWLYAISLNFDSASSTSKSDSSQTLTSVSSISISESSSISSSIKSDSSQSPDLSVSVSSEGAKISEATLNEIESPPDSESDQNAVNTEKSDSTDTEIPETDVASKSEIDDKSENSETPHEIDSPPDQEHQNQNHEPTAASSDSNLSVANSTAKVSNDTIAAEIVTVTETEPPVIEETTEMEEDDGQARFLNLMLSDYSSQFNIFSF